MLVSYCLVRMPLGADAILLSVVALAVASPCCFQLASLVFLGWEAKTRLHLGNNLTIKQDQTMEERSVAGLRPDRILLHLPSYSSQRAQIAISQIM